MLTTALPRRSVALLAVLPAVTAIVLSLATAPAQAQETDDEGGTRSLRDALDEAATAYRDAKAALEESEKRELKLLVKLEELEEERDDLVEEVQITAASAYRTGRIGPLTAILNANSPTSLFERMAAVDMLAMREAEQLTELETVRTELETRQAELAEEIALQEEELEKQEEAKEKAEEALFAIGGGASGQFEAYPSEDAKPAPRNSDGSFSPESCSEPDPTVSGGCLTPRTLHALNEAQTFGFTRYTSCYRNGSFGEHPKGRACDFSSAVGGFAGAATGSDKTYGDRLASFFVHNADALAVQYVIWYRQIWFPGRGWSSYGGADGTPNNDHTNHVHVSIR